MVSLPDQDQTASFDEGYANEATVTMKSPTSKLRENYFDS